MSKIYKLVLQTAFLCLFAPAFAQYDAGDSTAIKAIVVTNFSGTTALNWATEADPNLWDGVEWNTASPKRIIRLNLANGGRNGGRDDDGSNSVKANFTVLSGSYTVHGIATALTGSIDFTPFSFLEEILLNGNTDVTGINITGLTNLQKVRLGRTKISSLDASNLTALTNLHAKISNSLLSSLNVSGCTNLARLKMNADNLTSLNITGCTNLEQIQVRGSEISSLDLTGMNDLKRLKIKDSQISSLNGLSSCTALKSLSIANTKISGVINITGLNSLNQLGAKTNSITSFTGIETLNSLTLFNASDNKMSLTNAVKARYNPVIRNTNNDPDPVENQTPYSNIYIDENESVDFSDQAVIDSNGTNINTKFELYNSSNVLQATNTTGIFPIATQGEYYVIMTNSSVSITANITVLGPCYGGPYSVTDSMGIQNIRANNFTASTTLNWDLPCPLSWHGVVWDTTVTPARIVKLVLPLNNRTGGNTNNGQSPPNNLDKEIDYSVNTIQWGSLQSGKITSFVGDIDFTPFTELNLLVLNDNNNVENIDVSGLNKLEYLYFGRARSLQKLDVSGLQNLKFVTIKKSNVIKSIDASDCPNLTIFKSAWEIDSLTTANFSGSTNLEKINLKECPRLENLDITGVTKLKRFVVGSYATDHLGNLNNFTAQLSQNKDMRKMSISWKNFDGELDLTGMDSLIRFNAHHNNFTAVIGVDSSMTELEDLRIDNNRLNLDNAVDLGYNTYAYDDVQTSPQVNDGQTVLFSDGLNYNVYDSIIVQGVKTGSTFKLYKYTPTAVLDSTNSTGIFTFSLADTGKYYVEMSNSSVTVTTDTIYVLGAAARIVTTINNMNFDSVVVDSSATRTLTVSNTGSATLNVSNITLPAGYSIDATTGTIAANGSKTYTVTFTPTDSLTYSGTITVTNDAKLSGGNNEVNVTGIGYYLPVDSTIGINENKESLISFYPNPTSSLLYFKNNVSVRDLFIYSIDGTLVKKIDAQIINYIDMSALESGMYFIQSADKKVNQKVVKM